MKTTQEYNNEIKELQRDIGSWKDKIRKLEVQRDLRYEAFYNGYRQNRTTDWHDLPDGTKFEFRQGIDSLEEFDKKFRDPQTGEVNTLQINEATAWLRAKAMSHLSTRTGLR